MKALTLFAALSLITISAAFAAPTPKEVTIDVVPSRYQNLFIFKVDRKFKGANVEVSYANGDVIANLKMEKRKLTTSGYDHWGNPKVVQARRSGCSGGYAVE